jgi:hypothetical protein
VATQTEDPLGTRASVAILRETRSQACPARRRRGTPQSAPEAGTRGRQGGRGPFKSRAVCSSSSETDHPQPSQGEHPPFFRPLY